MCILIPIDGSQCTNKTLAWLATRNEMFGKAWHYTLVCVQSPIPGRAARAVGRELVRKLHDDETAASTRSPNLNPIRDRA